MVVVLDPGHGGHDQGCNGSHSIEKVLTLQMAKKLSEKIKSQYHDVDVILTREKDEFVSLRNRAEIANKNGADLFISLHCNALNIASVKGTETYVMGLHNTEENLSVAKRENQSILYENDYRDYYDGYDPNSPEAHIVMSFHQNAYMKESIAFANDIESAFDKNDKIKSRGVRQAGFVVLRMAAMPSVLIETGFLTNGYDQDLLKSNQGQEAITNCILEAFDTFKGTWNQNQNANYIRPNVSVKIPESHFEKSHLKKEIKNSIPSSKTGEIKNDLSKDLMPEKPEQKTKYNLQLAATVNKIDSSHVIFQRIKNPKVIYENSLYKYYVGPFESKALADDEKTNLLELGFKGVFIVPAKSNTNSQP